MRKNSGARRVVEAQGRQRVDHPEIPGVTAKEGLDANDSHNELGWYAVFLLGTGQGRLVLAPEVHAPGDTRLGDEHRPVLAPLLDPLGGPGDGVKDRLLALGLAKHAHQLLTGKTVVAGHLTDEFGHLRRAFVFASLGMGRTAQEADQADPRRISRRPATHCLH